MAQTNINREVDVLRSWSHKRFDGSPIPGEAFGLCTRPEFLKRWNPSKDYNFSIEETKGILTLEVDYYTAARGPFASDDNFDVDEWEDAKLFLHAQASRQNYLNLQSVARALLAGRDAFYPTGEVIKGVVPC
ncbi:MAG: hypothetical protein K2W33_07465 [Burkholderiales bacterium]|nr:hypothetical protein [Burkholderiales bacterium]